LRFRSGDRELQVVDVLLALFNAFGVRDIDHGGPIESVQPRQKSLLELGVKGIGSGRSHLWNWSAPGGRSRLPLSL
jgi:hypothetical protein